MDKTVNQKAWLLVPPGFSSPGNAAGLIFDPSHVHVYANSLLVEGAA